MDLTQLANLGEFIGGVAVLVTLVYLAVQVRQARRVGLNAALDKGVDSWRDVLGPLIENVDLYRRGAMGFHELDFSERHKFAMLIHQVFAYLENSHAKFRNRIVDPTEGDRLNYLTRWYLACPGIADWWENDGSLYTAPFAGTFAPSLMASRMEPSNAPIFRAPLTRPVDELGRHRSGGGGRRAKLGLPA